MKDIYSAIGKIVLTMFCFGMLSQSNVLHAQANAAGPICGKAFLSEPGPGMYWSEAANVRCDDNEDRAYAAPLTKGQFTQVLKVTDFGFALPADARSKALKLSLFAREMCRMASSIGR
jgi:hypothetical protein